MLVFDCERSKESALKLNLSCLFLYIVIIHKRNCMCQGSYHQYNDYQRGETIAHLAIQSKQARKKGRKISSYISTHSCYTGPGLNFSLTSCNQHDDNQKGRQFLTQPFRASKWFQRKRLKCEKLMDGGCNLMGKSFPYFLKLRSMN